MKAVRAPMGIFLFFTTLLSYSQSNRKHNYYLDEKLSTVPVTNAVFRGIGEYQNDAFELKCYSIDGNNLEMVLHFSDSTLDILHGLYSTFYKDHQRKVEGTYLHDSKEGLWKQWDSLGRVTDSTVYLHNKVMTAATYYFRHDLLAYYTLIDSLNDTYQTISYDSLGQVISKVNFKGQKGVRTYYSTTGIATNTLFTREEREAVFPGGDIAWVEYLSKKLNPNIPVKHNAPAGKYKVMVKFIVLKDGSIGDVIATTNFGYGMENEAVRIIQYSPKWIPASQYGRKVNAYRRQPITFVVE